MSPTPVLVFNSGIYYGKSVFFRRGYFILKVHSQDDSLATVAMVIDNVMGGISYEVHHKFVGRWAYLSVDPDTDILTLIKDLNQNPQVQYAEPDLRMDGRSESRDPGDPYLYTGPESPFRQWGISYINLFEVWKTQAGDDSALIGLVDSGVPTRGENDGTIAIHSRLNGRLDHIEFDGNRFIAGYNLLYSPPIVWPQDGSGYHHGSHMAGIIAARENNRDADDEFIGTAGVNWGTPIYVSVVMDSGNQSTIGLVYLAVAEILEYAADNGNPNVVINLSINYSEQDLKLDSDLGPPGTPGTPVLADDGGTAEGPPSSGGTETATGTDTAETPSDPMKSMNDMFEMIVEAGAIICISAGNGDTDDAGVLIEQPARLGVETGNYAPHVLAVGAINSSGRIYEHSGRGVADMVFAPGEDVCTVHTNNFGHQWYQDSGTSVANAHVSGLAALLWSEDPTLKAADVVRCIKKTCQFPDTAGGDTGVESEYLSHGVVNANAALQALRGVAELWTPAVVFEDAEPGLDHEKDIVIAVTSCRSSTFTVSVSGHAFGIAPGTYPHDPCSGDDFTLTAVYRAEDGDTESGIVSVVWDQRPDYHWEIGISASRRSGRPSICLVLDKSASMGSSSGLESYTRLEVLQYSAGLLVDMLDMNDGLVSIAFDSAAVDLTPYRVIQPESHEADRAQFKSDIDALAPGGTTSIAAGILAAKARLDTLPVDDHKAIIILTDGKQTNAPWVEEIAEEGLPYPVYAIGMGTASSLQPEGLDTLAGITDGYSVLTGSLNGITENEVAEFLAQILADIRGGSVPFDPTQNIRPGAVQRFGFPLGEEDKEVEILVMRPPGAPLEFKVFGPAGWPLDPRNLVLFESGRLVRLRFPGPAVPGKARPPASGHWQVEIATPRQAFTRWIRDLKKSGRDTRGLEQHGPSYTLRVHTLSNLRLKCRTFQSGYAPGAALFLQVRLTDRGRSLRLRPTVTARLTDPRGTVRTLPLSPVSPGLYEISAEALVPGIYTWRITAEGRSSAGHAFRRECRLTGAVWRSQNPPPA